MDDETLLQPGQKFGRYEIVRVIGRGGMGAVYEARHSELGKPVALKTMLGKLVRDAAAVERFLREGRAASSVRHPHVADVIDFGVEGGVPFLVMELLEGESLGDALERRGPLPVEQIASILVPVVSAIGAAHEAGVIHRDLKPENVFLARARKGTITPKVLDFGISRLTHENTRRLTQTGSVLGTPHFMPPEQARGKGDVSPLWDQYALGVMLYECATGKLPYNDDNFLALVQLIIVGEHQPPRALRPDLPVAFAAIIERAMNVDPSQRFADVIALGAALLPYADSATQAMFAREFESATRLASEPPTAVDLRDIPSLALDIPTLSLQAMPRQPTTIRQRSGEVSSVSSRPPRSRWRAILGTAALLVGVGAGIIVAQMSTHRAPRSASVVQPGERTLPVVPASVTADAGHVPETAILPTTHAHPSAAVHPVAPAANAHPPFSTTPHRTVRRPRTRPRTHYAPSVVY